MAMNGAAVPHVVIIGAGPAGLAAAHRALEKNCRVTVIEKSGQFGGKGGSRQYGGCIVDFGPHAFHAMSPEITGIIEAHGGGELYDLPIQQVLYITEKPMKYPLSLTEAIRSFPPEIMLRCAVDFLAARLRSKFVSVDESNFRSFGISAFGKSLYDLCFGDYSERVWDSSASLLSVEFARRKLPNLSLTQFIWEALTGARSENKKSYLKIRRYLYHRRGIGRVFEALAEDLRSRGAQFITGATIKNIEFSSISGDARKLALSQPDTRVVRCDFLVSTCPMTDLVNYFFADNEELLTFTEGLPFRHGLIINVIINRPKLMDCHWAYLVNKRFRFNRISEPKNFSDSSAPPDKTLLMLERICTADGADWRRDDEAWRPDVEAELAFFGVAPDEIESIFLTRMENAFPFYLVGYEKKKKDFFLRLAQHRNLVSTGRYGLYVDVNMHDAMALGREAVDHVLDDRVSSFYTDHESIPSRYRRK